MSTIFNLIIINTILSSVMILFVLLAKGALKNKLKPAIASMLWIMVMVRMLVPFSIESPINIWSFMPEKEPAPAEETIPSAEYNYAPESYTMESEFDMPGAISPYAPAGMVYDEPSEYTTHKPTTFVKIKTAVKSIDIPSLLASIWIVFAVGILGTNIIKMLIFAFFRNKGTAPSENVLSSFQKAKEKMSIRKPIDIFISTDITVPMAYSLFSPKILLPKNMIEHMDETKMELILMHEMMHIKRLDILKNYLWLLAKAIYWFNPLVWIGYRQYVSDTEICCDYHVMKRLDEDLKIHYSQSLLDAAKMINKKPVYSAPYMLSFCESETKLRRRIMNILQPIKQSKKQAAVLAIMIMVISVCCFTTACQQQEEAEPPVEITQPEESSELITAEPEQLNPDIERLMMHENKSNDYEFRHFELYRETADEEPQMIYYNFDSRIYSGRLYIQDAEAFPKVQLSSVQLDMDFAEKAVEYFMEGDIYFPLHTQHETDLEINAFKNEVAKFDNLEYNQGLIDELLKDLERGGNQPAENRECEIEFEEYENGKSFMVKSYNSNDYPQYLQMHATPSGIHRFYFEQGDFILGYSAYGLREIATADINISEQSSNINDAYLQAINAVDFFTDGMELSNMFVGKKINSYLKSIFSEYDLYEKSDKICYMFLFTPAYDGISSISGLAGSFEKSIHSAYDHMRPTQPEYIVVTVDESGIGTFEWIRCSSTYSVESDEYTIISLDDALDIFEENAFEGVGEWQSGYSEEEDVSIINIDTIYLGMISAEEYTAVPAYAIQGSRRKPHESFEDYAMIINAVDGSIIYQNS